MTRPLARRTKQFRNSPATNIPGSALCMVSTAHHLCLPNTNTTPPDIYFSNIMSYLEERSRHRQASSDYHQCLPHYVVPCPRLDAVLMHHNHSSKVSRALLSHPKVSAAYRYTLGAYVLPRRCHLKRNLCKQRPDISLCVKWPISTWGGLVPRSSDPPFCCAPAQASHTTHTHAKARQKARLKHPCAVCTINCPMPEAGIQGRRQVEK